MTAWDDEPPEPLTLTLNVLCQRCQQRVAHVQFGPSVLPRGLDDPDWSQAYAEGLDITVPGTVTLSCRRCRRGNLQVSIERVRQRLLNQWQGDTPREKITMRV